MNVGDTTVASSPGERVADKRLLVMRRVLVLFCVNAVLLDGLAVTGRGGRLGLLPTASVFVGVLVVNFAALIAAPVVSASAASDPAARTASRAVVLALSVLSAVLLAVDPPATSALKAALLTPIALAALSDDPPAIAGAAALVALGLAAAIAAPQGPPVAEIVDFLPQLWGVVAIAVVPATFALAALRHGPELVSAWRDSDRVRPGPTPLPRTQARAENTRSLHRMISAGLSDEEIERLHPRSAAQIAHERELLERLADVAELLRIGRSYEEIATELGLTADQVRYATRKLSERYGAADKRSLRHLLRALETP